VKQGKERDEMKKSAIIRLREGMQKHFRGDVPGHAFICPMSFALLGQVAIDIVSLDAFLQKRYRSEYPDGVSLSQFITKKYGKEANEFVKYWIQGEQE
jgi:hypothetical protein